MKQLLFFIFLLFSVSCNKDEIQPVDTVKPQSTINQGPEINLEEWVIIGNARNGITLAEVYFPESQTLDNAYVISATNPRKHTLLNGHKLDSVSFVQTSLTYASISNPPLYQSYVKVANYDVTWTFEDTVITKNVLAPWNSGKTSWTNVNPKVGLLYHTSTSIVIEFIQVIKDRERYRLPYRPEWPQVWIYKWTRYIDLVFIDSKLKEPESALLSVWQPPHKF